MLRTLVSTVLVAANVIAQSNFPPPPASPVNPTSTSKQLLGMALFFEEQLSSTGTVACATCHAFPSGGADPRAMNALSAGPDAVFGTADDQRTSPGIPAILADGSLIPYSYTFFEPKTTKRRAPSVINSGYHTHLMYDGANTSLEELIPGPLFNVREMGHAGRTWTDVIDKLAGAKPLTFASNLPSRLQTFLGNHDYPGLFQQAFGTTAITSTRIVHAIACYLRTLNSDQSKWDLHLHGQAQLTAQEQLGLQLFTSQANGATSCHTCHGDFDSRVLTEGPVAGQMTMTQTGPYGSPTPQRLVFHNIGVRPPAEDIGRLAVSQEATDNGKFRVASLRNVALSAPYFHNGSATTLRDAIDFYDRGGDFHVNQAANLTARNYTPAEKDALEALLRTLTDPRVAAGVYPFDAPTLGSQSGRFASSMGQSGTTAVGPLVATAPFAAQVGEDWFRLTLSGVTPGTATFLMLDLVPAAGPQPFDVELAISPAFGIYAQGLAQGVWYLPGQGFAQAPLPLPNLPSLSGVTLYAQWVVLEPSAQWPLATSNALRIPLL